MMNFSGFVRLLAVTVTTFQFSVASLAAPSAPKLGAVEVARIARQPFRVFIFAKGNETVFRIQNWQTLEQRDVKIASAKLRTLKPFFRTLQADGTAVVEVLGSVVGGVVAAGVAAPAGVLVGVVWMAGGAVAGGVGFAVASGVVDQVTQLRKSALNPVWITQRATIESQIIRVASDEKASVLIGFSRERDMQDYADQIRDLAHDLN